ncbi:transposase domain-containing protein [Metasolibacillus meyeri]|uniref:transposase domain-containing protein n=1 Tax=Metasolibacillus meyeri TaxID=1071052 RepID=UPI000D306329|nr:transposase domain-containing protein [Metasolibacillus meyeri]
MYIIWKKLIIYRIVETAKENQLNPLRYLSHVLEQLPLINITDDATLYAFMPWSDKIPTNCHVPKITT